LAAPPDNDLVLIGDDFASGEHALMRADGNGLLCRRPWLAERQLSHGALFKNATRALSPATS
jgi:hypothetical protein